VDPSQPSEPAGSPSRDTERRRVTVLFADISGFTSLVESTTPGRAYEVVTGCLRLLDAIARKHGASVDKYLGDCVMAVFGLPTALEDAPRAAVNAAIEMLGAVRSLNCEQQLAVPLEIHIGINSGLAVSGDVSGPVLREFAVMGDSVNVASRLKDKAPPGQVYVGPETYRHTRDSFAYEHVAELALKGRRAGVQAWKLVSGRPQLYRPRGRAERSIFSELVGRERELGVLLAALRSLRTGEGRITAVIGEAGLGKSRLLDEFQRTPAAAAATCLVGRSTATGRTLSFHPFADLLRHWAGVEDADPEEVARAAFAGAVERLELEDRDRIRAVLARLVGLPPTEEEAPLLASIQDEAMETTILRAVRSILERTAARSPLVLVFEDLHWADASSLGLLEALLSLADGLPVLFLLACRPGFPETSGRVLRTARAERAGGVEEIVLAPLAGGDTRLLLRNLCGGGRVPPEFLARLEEKAAGNPFFIEEVVLALLAQGALVRDAVGLHAARTLAEVVVPDTIHEVILSRIDRLTHEAKHALQLGAVVGRRFHVDVVQAMQGGAGDLTEPLLELEQRQMVEPADRRRRVYHFVHPLIQEVAYDSILETRLEALHLAAGNAIAEHLSDALPGYYGMLAYHFGLARDAERAEAYLNLAGQEATQLAAADEALFFFEEAARLFFARHGEGGDPEARAELEWNIARAHANRGDMVDAIEHINRALRLLGEWVPTGWAAQAEAARGALSVLRALYLPARRRRAASARDRKVIELRFHRARAQTTADPRGFFLDSLRAFRQLWAVDPASVEGVGGMVAGLVGPLSFLGLSISLGHRGLELARPLVGKDTRERFLFEFMRYLHHFLAGDWSDAHEIDPGLTDEVLKLGVIWDVTNYLGLLVEKKTQQGAFGAASGRLEELGKLADTYRYDLARSTHRAQTTFLLLERGLLREAREAATLYYTQHAEQLISLLALGARSKARALEGDLQGAEEDLAAAERILAATGRVAPYQGGSVHRSRLLLEVTRLARARAAGDRNELRRRRATARRAACRALRSASACAMRRPEVFRLEGTRRWLSGRPRAARRWWERSLREAEALGARPDGARTRLEIGLWLAEVSPDGARPHLRAAREAFIELGLEWDLRQTQLPGMDLMGMPELP
jgi:class 3 adenylate cyclase